MPERSTKFVAGGRSRQKLRGSKTRPRAGCPQVDQAHGEGSHWRSFTMPRLLRRKLRCHYCNAYCSNQQAGIPRTWLCPSCDAPNFLDEVRQKVFSSVCSLTWAARRDHRSAR